MKSRINHKAAIKAALIMLGIAFILCIVARPISGIVLWLYSIGDYFAYAFCNPSLWLLGFDEVLWKCPVEQFNNPADGEPSSEGVGLSLLFLFSAVAHITTLVFTIKGFKFLWKYTDKEAHEPLQ